MTGLPHRLPPVWRRDSHQQWQVGHRSVTTMSAQKVGVGGGGRLRSMELRLRKLKVKRLVALELRAIIPTRIDTRHSLNGAPAWLAPSLQESLRRSFQDLEHYIKGYKQGLSFRYFRPSCRHFTSMQWISIQHLCIAYSLLRQNPEPCSRFLLAAIPLYATCGRLCYVDFARGPWSPSAICDLWSSPLREILVSSAECFCSGILIVSATWDLYRLRWLPPPLGIFVASVDHLLCYVEPSSPSLHGTWLPLLRDLDFFRYTTMFAALRGTLTASDKWDLGRWISRLHCGGPWLSLLRD